MDERWNPDPGGEDRPTPPPDPQQPPDGPPFPAAADPPPAGASAGPAGPPADPPAPGPHHTPPSAPFAAPDPSAQYAGGAPPAPPSYGGDGGDGGGDGAPKRSRKGLFIGIASGIVVLALIGAGVSWFVLRMPQPEDTAESYVSAWSAQDYAAMADLTTGGDAEQTLTRLDENLGVDKATVELGEVSEDGDSATARFTATLALSNAGDWTYDGELPLTRADGTWKVDFGPAVVHPDLKDGTTLTRVNEWGERGHILAADGSRLDTDSASGSVKMLTGRVGTASKKDLKDLGPAYEVGDPVGVTGLQKQYEERLAGTATTAIRVVPVGEKGDGAAPKAAEDAPTVGSVKGSDGKDVTTSIDPAVQQAAASAITDQGKPTALVAVRPSSGEILAAANVPGGYNRALEGRYAPGSSFKIVSYEALFENGFTRDATMSCPKNAKVGGWKFKNAHDAAYGQQTVTEAFATSCNTALVQQVPKTLDPETFTATAEKFGMNADLKIGLPTHKPSFPTPEGTTSMATQSIGQGKILTSPLHMATVPAAIAEGSWRSPVLVTKPKVPDQPKPTKIPHAEQIRPMMREVVANGTAKSANLPDDVYGKTGSAEFGTAQGDEELKTHAWFVGYQGDIAFAVVVEGGGGGGSVAAPLAAKFLSGL